MCPLFLYSERLMLPAMQKAFRPPVAVVGVRRGCWPEAAREDLQRCWCLPQRVASAWRNHPFASGQKLLGSVALIVVALAREPYSMPEFLSGNCPLGRF
jgi:hypothetical protein